MMKTLLWKRCIELFKLSKNGVWVAQMLIDDCIQDRYGGEYDSMHFKEAGVLGRGAGNDRERARYSPSSGSDQVVGRSSVLTGLRAQR